MWGIMLIRAMGYVCGTKCAMLGLAECGHWDVPLSGRKTLEASGTPLGEGVESDKEVMSLA